MFNRYLTRIADLAAKNRLPSLYEGSEFVEAGGLMSYAANDADSFRRAAYYVEKILKGAADGDHSDMMAEIFDRYATTPELEALVLQGARESHEINRVFIAGLAEAAKQIE